jgi:hypothetical protein
LSDGSANSPSTIRASPPVTEQEPEPEQQQVKSEAKEGVPDPILEKRKNSVQEEKKRGQRLFGGLLSTLSRSTPDGAAKRRVEIERRQAAKTQQLAIDNKAREAEKLVKLKEERKVGQVLYNEQSVSTDNVIQVWMC